jgi:hypothetical protein
VFLSSFFARQTESWTKNLWINDGATYVVCNLVPEFSVKIVKHLIFHLRLRSAIEELVTFIWSCWSYELPTIRVVLPRKMRSMENARPEKCKECEVARAAYSHSIKKFADGNFSYKLAKGARVLILHTFVSLSVASVDDDVSKRRDKSAAIDAYGWRVTQRLNLTEEKEGAYQKFRVRIWSQCKFVHISYFIRRSVSRYALRTGDKDIVIVFWI